MITHKKTKKKRILMMKIKKIASKELSKNRMLKNLNDSNEQK